jgi:hypothetical protein
MRQLAALWFLTLASCSGSNTVRHLEEAKWGNSAQPCSENYATFSGKLIAVHPNGQTLPMFKIVDVNSSWSSPDEVAVRIEPSAEMYSSLRERSRDQQARDFYGRGFELNLRLDDKRMWITSVTVAGEKKPVKGELTMFNMFDCETA